MINMGGLTVFIDYPDPAGPVCLAQLGVECYCAKCESRRLYLAPTATTNFEIEPNNYTSVNAGNRFSRLTAGHSTQFTTGTSYGDRNTDYYSSGFSISLPETDPILDTRV